MADIIDFERNREAHLHKRKEAKVDELRRAFRLARGDCEEKKSDSRRKRRKSPKK